MPSSQLPSLANLGFASDNDRVQILCLIQQRERKVPEMLEFLKTERFNRFAILLLHPVLLLAIVLGETPFRFGRLSPLRRVVGAELEISSYHPNGKIRGFSVVNLLECGHWKVDYPAFEDLVNAYSQAACFRARRHRCHECAEISLSKKPSASVGLDSVLPPVVVRS